MGSGQGRGESDTSPRKLTAAETDDQAFALRKTGATFQSIGDSLGVSRQRAHAGVKRALAKLPPIPALEDFRKTELATLDVLQVSLWPKVLEGDAEAVRAVVRVMERRTKLVGGDVQPRLNSVGTDVVQGVVDQLIGMAVRMLTDEQRPAFLAQVETTLLQITDGRDG